MDRPQPEVRQPAPFWRRRSGPGCGSVARAAGPGRIRQGKPVGAVVAAARVLRTRRSGLRDLARPLMHGISDAHGVSVYLSKMHGPSSPLRDWDGAACRTDLSLAAGRQYPGPAGASGVITAAFAASGAAEWDAPLSDVAWYRKPSFAEFSARVEDARQAGFAVDCAPLFRGITQVSVPVLSPSWGLLLIRTAAGPSHDLNEEAVAPFGRAMTAAARLSESVRLLHLG
jgi:DNA-binding IclR family transcriptional regulator